MNLPAIAVLRSNPKDAALGRLLTSLSRIGRVECFLWDRQGDFKPSAVNQRIHYVSCGIRAGFYNLSTLFKLALFQAWLLAKLMNTACDVIHAVDLDTGLPGWLAAKLRRKKFVYQCLDPYYAILPGNWPKILASLARWLENRLITSADLFIITDLLRLPQHAGSHPRKIVEIANVPILAETESHLPGGDFMAVGYLGSLIEGRNLRTIIETCGELEQDGVRLVIGGFGPLEEDIETHARRWPNITFQGWLPYDKLLQEESRWDLFVHITDPANESQRWVSPNKLFEAMAFGRPIIVGKDTLAAQRVAIFDNGVAVSYNSKLELQEAILRFKNDPGLARQMGLNGQEEFQRNWRPEFMEKRLLEEYLNILDC